MSTLLLIGNIFPTLHSSKPWKNEIKYNFIYILYNLRQFNVPFLILLYYVLHLYKIFYISNQNTAKIKLQQIFCSSVLPVLADNVTFYRYDSSEHDWLKLFYLSLPILDISTDTWICMKPNMIFNLAKTTPSRKIRLCLDCSSFKKIEILHRKVFIISLIA